MRSRRFYAKAPRSLSGRAAAVFVAGGLLAYCCAPSDELPNLPAVPLPAAGESATVSEEVQLLLAQGGCPGWIALAGDEQLQASLNEGGVIRQQSWHETAARQPQSPPSVQYPEPVRVAAAIRGSSPELFAEPPTPAVRRPPTGAGPALQLVQLPPVTDDEELIPESEDLLRTSPEISGDAPLSDETPAAEAEGELPNAEEANDDAALGATDPPSAENPSIATPLPPTTTPDEEDLLDAADDLLVPPPVRQTPEPLPTLPGPALVPAPAPAIVPPAATGPSATPITPADSAAAPAASPAAQTSCEFVAKSLYPAAAECRVCHEKIYDEWSMSSHAYAFVSPMFHKFEQKINDVASGTIGYFCYRCHTPAGTSLGISRAAPLWDVPQVAREGVTCVACHRITEMYGKTNGERRIEPGPIFAPVYGTIGGDGVAIAAAQKSHFKVHTSPHDQGPGVDMHASGECFPQLGQSEFCTSCHQVAVYPGIKLEVVWEQYRASPACKKGISCQNCHMGRIPGVPSGYESGPAAVINNKNVHPNRKHSNHTFYGPGYSIAHPGVFPFNPKADRWSVRDWLTFDWRAGWGTDAFEDAVDDGRIHATFPDVWKEADDRHDAREIIDDNLKKKAVKDRLRMQVMENGSHVDGPFFEAPARVGQELKFSYVVVNRNEGHNLPTASLGAQPQLWANVVLIGPRGQRLWESGYLDGNGDLADIHSVAVRNKQLPFDWQLFNLQTMFLITGAKGTDREFYLPVNIDVDPLPFIRPAGQPVSVINHPPFIRMEARSLAPLGSRNVPYKVPGHLLCEPGRYRLSFRMRNRMEPMYFMRFCESTPEMQRAMIEGTLDFHESSVEFEVR